MQKQREGSTEEDRSMDRASLYEQHMPLTWDAKLASITSSSYKRKNDAAEKALKKAKANLDIAMKKFDAAMIDFEAADNKSRGNEKQLKRLKKMKKPVKTAKYSSERIAEQSRQMLSNTRGVQEPEKFPNRQRCRRR